MEEEQAAGCKKIRSSYSVEFKLRVVEHAKTNSLRRTAIHYGLNETQVRRWKKDSDNLQEIAAAVPAKSRKHFYKNRKAKYRVLEQEIKAWVLEKRSAGHQISGTRIMLQARKFAMERDISEFKGSPKWVYNFMKRNNFVRRATTSTGQKLPDDWEIKAAAFRGFVSRNKEDLPLDRIANMDEVPVTFDLPSNFTIEKRGTSDVKINTTGNEKAKFTVVLCATADGGKLPAYVIFRRKTIPAIKVPPNIVLSANSKSCMDSVETQLWAEKIWNKRKNTFFDKKGLLILDSAPGHKKDTTLDKFKKMKTTIAMIPGGLTKKLQPLDISVNKSFKAYLRRQWEDWMVDGFHEFTKSGHIKRASYDTVCNWISNAWTLVPTTAIINGFRKTEINFYEDYDEDVVDNHEEDDSDEEEEHDEVREKLFDIFAECQISDSEEEPDECDV